MACSTRSARQQSWQGYRRQERREGEAHAVLVPETEKEPSLPPVVRIMLPPSENSLPNAAGAFDCTSRTPPSRNARLIAFRSAAGSVCFACADRGDTPPSIARFIAGQPSALV